MRRLLPLLLLLGGCAAAPAAELDPLTVARSGRPNDALLCPPGACAAAADAVAPHLALAAADQAALWREVITGEPRTTLAPSADPLVVRATQRSRWLGFTDDIVIRIMPADTRASSFAAYSRSRVGYHDLGVNRRRLERWTRELQRLAPTPPTDAAAR
jgi:uncharacterized protein (DUF1499 family)